MKRTIPLLVMVLLLITLNASAQPAAPATRVFTADIDNFWVAYDSVQTTTDSLQQLHFIQTLYVDKGTPGLKAFMEVRGYSTPQWVSVLRSYPKFWRSIRPDIIAMKPRAGEIEVYIQKFRSLYPPLTDAKIYFTVGCLNSGGTTMDSLILIGAEIAAGNPATDVSEFPNNWLAGVFQSSKTADVVPLNIHEYVHTQQKKTMPANLLGEALKEGSADFITELVMASPMQNNYIVYGKEHEAELKQQFATEMFFHSTTYRWLYSATQFRAIPDLGYFMGYSICAAYYRQAQNKQQAIRDIIKLNYGDTAATEDFLKNSGYYTTFPDKAASLAAIENHIPAQTGSRPFANGDVTVDPGLQAISLQFSQPLVDGWYAIHADKESKDSFPAITKMELSADKRTLMLHLTLLPGQSYTLAAEFLSAEGYYGKSQLHFKTRPGGTF
jgi:hypothetical protein